MPTNRTPRRRPAARFLITPAAVAAFRLCKEILAAHAENRWEDKGGRRREYLDASSALHHELGLMPWEESPVNADGPCPAWVTDKADWAQAQALRRRLEDA